MAELRDWLTPHQQDLLADLSARQQLLNRWDGDRPIALLERCWLRLQIHPISKLSAVLPPDNSGDAPELIHFRNLIRTGFSRAEAEEQCWEDFGKTACSEALQRFWAAQDQGCNGWTLQAYLDLLSRYRSWIETAGPNPLPVLVLARTGSPEHHRLIWHWPASLSVGHTCR